MTEIDPIDASNIVAVSDMHIGCRLGLCPPGEHGLDDGGSYVASERQQEVWAYWCEFWQKWVPDKTRGEPYVVVVNGDAVEGMHHRAMTTISNNPVDQRRLAEVVLRPIVDGPNCIAYYHIRGTESHAGDSGNTEETLARDLGAVPNAVGQHARWELYKRIGGKAGPVFHFAHHIGTTGSQHFESSAVTKELTEAYIEAARWQDEPLRGVIRAHRHRGIQVRLPAEDADGNPIEGIGLVTPGWQMKTPFAYRIAGARQAQPQFGGSVISIHKGETYATSYVRRLTRPEAE